jgi:hypothetical protein
MSKKSSYVVILVVVVIGALLVFEGPALWHLLLRMHGMH